MSDARVVLSTVAEASAAQRLADALVTEGLAACVTALPGAHSVYRWQGRIERAAEIVLLIKCRAADYPRLEARLRALHPYELPEILCVPVEAGLAAYLAWLERPDG